LSQAGRVLSPPQVDVLRAMAEQARATQRMQEITEPMLRKLSPLNPDVMQPKPSKPAGG
jgi:hypothetical protein